MSKYRRAVYYRRVLEIPELLSSRGAARVLGVTTRTVQRFAQDGTLTPAFRLDGLRGAILFYLSDVERLAENRRGKAAA